jgi:hypothetical protein
MAHQSRSRLSFIHQNTIRDESGYHPRRRRRGGKATRDDVRWTPAALVLAAVPGTIRG